LAWASLLSACGVPEVLPRFSKHIMPQRKRGDRGSESGQNTIEMAPENINELYKKTSRLATGNDPGANFAGQRKSLERHQRIGFSVLTRTPGRLRIKNHVGGNRICSGSWPRAAARINLPLRRGVGGSWFAGLGRIDASSIVFIRMQDGWLRISVKTGLPRLGISRHLVNLDDFVDFKQADLMDLRGAEAGQFDVIWGQSSWTHIQHKEEFLERWAWGR